MKVLILAPQARYEQYGPAPEARKGLELVFQDRTGTEAEWLAAGADAEVLVVTPVTAVTEQLIARMPKLRMIHSEGVGYDRIDLEAARKRGIWVCNNAGCNADAVAELAVTLMSMLLHRTLWGDRMMRQGRHAEAIRTLEGDIPPDLSVSTVGLVGFGNIAQATARRLRVPAAVFYYARHRRDPETEAALGPAICPFWSWRSGATSSACTCRPRRRAATCWTRLFCPLKPGAFLVNTARGAGIDDEALCAAIRSGRLAGAALDAYEPEPAGADHPLVRLAAEFPDRMILCPHQGGVNQSAYRRVVQMIFGNLEALRAGRRPARVVNGL
jgi:D-3-phosphoglycerate dehydrogenase